MNKVKLALGHDKVEVGVVVPEKVVVEFSFSGPLVERFWDKMGIEGPEEKPSLKCAPLKSDYSGEHEK